MKKILAFCFIVSVIVVLSGCGPTPKEDVFSIVENNYDAIRKACEEKEADALLKIEGVTKVNIVDGYVIVYCKGAGIAPSSQDYGFYFSAENSPIGVGCNLGIVCKAEELTPEGNGLQCVVGGNIFYTEHIQGNFYFYSNAY